MPDNSLVEASKALNKSFRRSVEQVQHFVFRNRENESNKGRSLSIGQLLHVRMILEHRLILILCAGEFAGDPKPAATAARTDAQTSKEQLGRSTWTLLHTMAAQYPEKPSKRQKRDVQTLVRLS